MGRLAVEGNREVHYEHYESGGSGVPLVLTHGWGMNARVWSYVTPHVLAAGHDVIAVDHRACGRSDHDFSDVSIGAIAGDLVSVLDEIGIQRTVVNGWSLGGAVATEAANRLGERCAGLVLTAGATPRFTSTDDWPHGVPAEGFDDWITALDDDRVSFLAGMAAGQTYVDVGQPVIDWMWWVFNEGGSGAHRTLAELGTIDQREIGSKLTCPSLSLHGRQDPTVPFAIGEYQAANFPNGRLVPLESGHAPFIEDRAAYRAALLEFLSEVG